MKCMLPAAVYRGPHRVLSIKAPWSYLICHRVKTIELRTRPLPKTVRDTVVLIHTSKVRDSGYTEIVYPDGIPPLSEDGRLPIPGKICAAVLFGNCIEYKDLRHFMRHASRHRCNEQAWLPGRKLYGWTIDRVQWLTEQMTFRGMLGFPVYDGDVTLERVL